MHHPKGSKILKIRFHCFCLTRAISSPPSNQRLPPFSSVVLSRFLLLLLVAGIPQTRLVDVIVFRTPRFTTRGEVPCSKLLTSLGQLPFRASILAPTLHKHPNTQNDIQIYIYIYILNHIKSTNININHKIQISENQLNKKLPAILCV